MKNSIIAKEGYPFIIVAVAIGLFFLFLKLIIASSIFWLIAIFIVWFFRNPERIIPQNERAIVSPADGKIIEVVKCNEDRYLKEKAVKISIFMSIFNVHINRAPISGKVKNIFYNKGKFLTANRDKASKENEQNAIIIETADGINTLIVQIAGFIARRIVCYIKSEDTLVKGMRFGLIRFGSRVDIFLPENIDIKVAIGAKVRGGETILGYLK